MKTFRYILDKTSRKFKCPACGRLKFVRVVDTASGEYLPEEYGRCDREVNCGYFHFPEQKIEEEGQESVSKIAPQREPLPSFIPYKIFSLSRTHYESNNFVKFLLNQFGEESAIQAITSYHIGTSMHWPGSVVFWQIDAEGKIHAGKIMLYHSTTGKRVRDPKKDYITWAHKALKLENYNLKQCLFGIHLLRLNPGRPIAIVESEKSAIIASIYFPKLIWLATGSLSNLTTEKCAVLKGKQVILFPDLGCLDRWKEKALEIERSLSIEFRVSDLLELHATAEDIKNGLDIADYLLMFPVNEFYEKYEVANKTFFFSDQRNSEILNTVQSDEIKEKELILLTSKTENTSDQSGSSLNEQWDIQELEDYFKRISLPTPPLKLNRFTTISDIGLFIESHLDIVKAKNGVATYLPYLLRLKELEHFLKSGLN
jgi:hypothetical protein